RGGDMNGDFRQSTDNLHRFRRPDLAAPGFLPQDVANLGRQEVWSEELASSRQQPERFLGVDLGDEPLDRDARVDDVAPHRARSSARISPLSEYGRRARSA